MIGREEIMGYKREKNFKGVVLEEILTFLSEKANFNIIKLPSKKIDKIAVDSSIDSESEDIVKLLIRGSSFNLKKCLPVVGKVIKPFYLFLDEEILLYAKIRQLKFKEQKKKLDKFKDFLDEFEEKHPEVKRAIVNSLLKLYKK